MEGWFVVRSFRQKVKKIIIFYRAAIELEDGRAYAIVDGVMGPRIFRMEAYADDSNSYFGCDETSWYWRWKGSDKEVELKNLGGVEW